MDELLEWTYRVQKADRASGGLEARLGHAGVSMTAAACDVMALQTMVDSGGPGHRIPPDVHPDAERVHEIVERMPLDQKIRLHEQARQGGAPDWCEGVEPMLVARRDERGRAAMCWLDAEGKPAFRSRHDYGYCEVELHPDPVFIDFSRQVYSLWRAALVELLARLARERLRDHVAVAPAAPVTPWLAHSGY